MDEEEEERSSANDNNVSLSAEYKEFNFHPNEGNYQTTICLLFISSLKRSSSPDWL